MDRVEVLIVGAGPTGLVLALLLASKGIRLRIIDKSAEPGTTSRAVAVQARTLELYSQLGLAEAVVQAGRKVLAVNLWVKGRHATRLPFADVGEGLTPYSSVLIFPQDEHERLLVARLEALGVMVERRTELLDMERSGSAVRARLRDADGHESVVHADYLAGCDGARSTVRETLGVGFPGGTYRHLFYVADVEMAGPTANGEVHFDLDDSNFLAVFPLAGEGRARLIGTVNDARAERADTLTFADVDDRAIAALQIETKRVNWFSTYRVHHRVAGQFRQGRCILLGDAAHIHSPVGGQGMNTGIGDAFNLAWKLEMLVRGQASETLLDSFEIERRAFARKLVATTDTAFSFVNSEGALARFVRTRIAPVVFGGLSGIGPVRRRLFRVASQLGLNYRAMPLSAGHAGTLRGGDRLPWVAGAVPDNFAPLTARRWQVHVYGEAGEALRRWCAARTLLLHEFGWRQAHAEAGLVRNALYAVRPDGYIGLIEPSGSAEALELYFAERGLRPS